MQAACPIFERCYVSGRMPHKTVCFANQGKCGHQDFWKIVNDGHEVDIWQQSKRKPLTDGGGKVRARKQHPLRQF